MESGIRWRTTLKMTSLIAISLFLFTGILSHLGKFDSETIVVKDPTETEFADQYIECVNLGKCEETEQMNSFVEKVLKIFSGRNTCAPSPNEKVNKLLAKYWSDLGCEKVYTFWRIAQVESNGKQVIHNRGLNRNGTIDFGWCGVNTIHRNKGETIANFEKRMYDLEENIKLCRAIYDNRDSWDTDGFNAWSTFNSKKYLTVK